MSQYFMPSQVINGFKLVCKTKSLVRDIPVYKFQSLKTGLHVIIANIEGPIVQGSFTIGNYYYCCFF